MIKPEKSLNDPKKSSKFTVKTPKIPPKNSKKALPAGRGGPRLRRKGNFSEFSKTGGGF